MAATLVGFTGLAVRAESPELLPPVSLWDSSYVLRAGAGFKDNVFLSPANPQSSPFLAVGAEALVLWFSPEGTVFTFFANGDASHYTSTSRDHNEYLFFSQAQLERGFDEILSGSLMAQYIYQDQILDVAASQTNRQAVPVRGHTITVRPGLKFALSESQWFGFEFNVTRQFFASP